MNDIIEVVKGLPKLACVGKIENVDIVDAELQLRLNFAEEYKRYLSEFGAISARRIELTGIIGVDYCNVVTATKQAWELNPQVPHNLYVVENTFIDGVIIWQDASGTIYQTSPGSQPRKIANNLADYLLSRIR